MRRVPLHLISEDPSKLVLSPAYGGTPQGSLDLPTEAGVFVDELADFGIVGVRVEGPNDYRTRVLFALGTADVSIMPPSAGVPVDGVAPMTVRIHPLGVAPTGFTAPPQWLVTGLSFGGVAFDTNILRSEYFNFNYNNRDPAWLFGFRAVRTGRTDVEPVLPAGAIASVRRMSVQVQPGTITFGRPTLDIPEGFGLALQPVLFVGTHAATATLLSIRDPQIADISYTSAPVPAVTVNFSAYNYVVLRAKGKAGQTTTLTLTAQGIDSMDIPVRIVRPVLLPEAQEYWVNGKALL